ncbi:DUF2905 domain-containing protein [Mucilaginibacter limnophilus]|uniref:DUF2905 domain-containing protein n=1 Tax=Mucilaginibacter limnophilus TaxID=1932778 RepID=A0A437MUU0_9SPHI|nr:DUF2905 domain-containing protein [Mucilaginibacter limnophilus]RVU01423.1 DUF2905 domain-containing protein [Mucilaginibacter limnophilus]
MPLNSETGKYIIIAGAVILLAGLLVYFWGDKLNWLGHLPGDIRIERENLRFYFLKRIKCMCFKEIIIFRKLMANLTLKLRDTIIVCSAINGPPVAPFLKVILVWIGHCRINITWYFI